MLLCLNHSGVKGERNLTDKNDNRDELALELETGGKDRKIALLMIANYLPRETRPDEIHEQTCRLCKHLKGGSCSFKRVCWRNCLFVPVDDFEQQGLRVITDLGREIRERRALAA